MQQKYIPSTRAAWVIYSKSSACHCILDHPAEPFHSFSTEGLGRLPCHAALHLPAAAFWATLMQFGHPATLFQSSSTESLAALLLHHFVLHCCCISGHPAMPFHSCSIEGVGRLPCHAASCHPAAAFQAILPCHFTAVP